MKDKQHVLSETISWLRFPLIIGVVLLHTHILGETPMKTMYVPVGKFPFFDIFEHIAKTNIGALAVPSFFFISGFLFFYHSEFNKAIFCKKNTKRIKTLFTPYIFWNTLYILFVILEQVIRYGWEPDKITVLNFTVLDFGEAYWTLQNGLGPLWFVRDLLIINLFTPLIHFSIRKFGFLPVAILGILYFINTFNVINAMPGLGTRCSFFYLFGAYFSIKKLNFIDVLGKYRWILLCLFSILTIVDTYYWYIGVLHLWLNKLTLICGVISIPLFVAKGVEQGKLKVRPLLVESSFFVFAFHMFIIYIPLNLWVFCVPINTFTATLMQLLIPITVSFTCVGIYYLLKKYSPQLALFLVGGR